MSNAPENIARMLERGDPANNVTAAVRDFLPILKHSSVIRECTWHPYGFLIAKPWANEALALRLHIWPVGPRTRQIPDWPVHSHPWDLHSYILKGSAINEIYKIQLVEGQSPRRLYSVGYDGSESVLQATEMGVACELASRQKYIPGDSYRVYADQYHATHVPEEDFAATIVLTSAPKTTPPYVVGQFNFEPQYRYARRVCAPETASHLVERLFEDLCN